LVDLPCRESAEDVLQPWCVLFADPQLLVQRNPTPFTSFFTDVVRTLISDRLSSRGVLPLRPERHVDSSMATFRISQARSLVNHLPS
jgi:hypothetical protein